MTVDEALARFTAKIDELIEQLRDQQEIMLMDRGATPQEVAAELAIYDQQMRETRADKLDDLRGWLERGGETLQ
jgi:hypothetical protein